MEIKEIKVEGYEKIYRCDDKNSGLKAIIAIHNTNLGPAIGGCRLWDYKTEKDMLEDVLRLSKGMTYKCAMAGLPFGGGKCVIMAKPEQKNRQLMEAMGDFIENVSAIYTGEDVGLTMDDVDILRERSTHITGVRGKSGDPSILTSVGVYHGIKACLDFAGIPIGQATILIRGVGNVGSKTAERLYPECKQLLVADLNLAKANKLKEKLENILICDPKKLDKKFDLLAPCALGKAIKRNTPKMLAEKGCKIIAGGANNQLSNSQVGKILFNKGILYAPDYVINGGGVISVSTEVTGESYDDAMKRVVSIGSTITEILKRSKEEKLPTNVVADKMADERIYGKK